MPWGNQDQLVGVSIPDISGNTIQTSVAFLALTYAPTSALDCSGYSEVDFYVRVSDVATITQINLQLQFSELVSPSPILDTDWATIQSQNVNAGIATLSDYTMQKTIPGGLTIYTMGITTPVRGRWMRLKVSAGAGGPGGLYTVNANRR